MCERTEWITSIPPMQLFCWLVESLRFHVGAGEEPLATQADSTLREACDVDWSCLSKWDCWSWAFVLPSWCQRVNIA